MSEYINYNTTETEKYRDVYVSFPIDEEIGYNEEWEYAMDKYLKKFEIERSGSGSGFGTRVLEYRYEGDLSWEALMAAIEVELPHLEMELSVEEMPASVEFGLPPCISELLSIKCNQQASNDVFRKMEEE